MEICKLTREVPSLQLCKALKEAGLPQDTLWYWVGNTYGSDSKFFLHDKKPYNPKGGWEVYAAPTVRELGELLLYEYQVLKHEDCFVGYHLDIGGLKVISNRGIIDVSEANCRAKILLWLIKHGHVKF